MRRMVKLSLLKKLWPKENLSHLNDETGVSIDSRSVEKGDVFFALHGELHDGHDFIEDALAKGASLIIAEEGYRERFSHSLPSIYVEDSLAAFSHLAHLHLKSLTLTSIAITGSNGKTTTKEMVKAALSHVLGEDVVYASEGNKNNHFGVPLSALEVTPQHQIAIFEMGMNHAGEISSLCRIVEPDMGLITNIGHAHEGNFTDGIMGVQHAKGELFMSLAQTNGTAIVNLDDSRVVAMAEKWLIQKRRSFGCNQTADIVVRGSEIGSTGEQIINLSTPQGNLSCMIPLLGEHHALNAAAALAVALALNLPLNDAAQGLSSMKKTAGRFLITHTKNGYVVIDDGYNANPTSMAAGVKASLCVTSTRRIAVIGAMAELGTKSAAHHRELGKLLAQHFDYVYFCGIDTKYAQKAALEEGLKPSHILYKDASVDLIKPLKMLVQKGDLVFVKGSLSANMQAVTRALID